MKTDQPSLEEVAECHGFPETVVVSVANHEAGKDEKEIDSQIAVVDDRDDRSAGSEGESLENVIKDDQQSGYAPQSVEELVMGFRIGEGR